MKEHKATIGNPIMPKHQTNVLETWNPSGFFMECLSTHECPALLSISSRIFEMTFRVIPSQQVRRRQLRRGWNAPMGHGLSDVIQGWHQGLQPVCWASLLVCLKMVWFNHPKSSGLTWSINVNHIISSIEVAILGDFGAFSRS
jgi:hypothetical protein